MFRTGNRRTSLTLREMGCFESRNFLARSRFTERTLYISSLRHLRQLSFSLLYLTLHHLSLLSLENLRY